MVFCFRQTNACLKRPERSHDPAQEDTDEKTAGNGLAERIVYLCLLLLTSTGYLAWVYHIMEMVPFRTADAVSMVAGYALQAAELGLFMAFARRGA